MSSFNPKLEQFFGEICGQIRYKCVHKAIVRELSSHIDEQKKAFTDQGMNEEAALEKAVEQMGDPADIGSRFNQLYRPQTDWFMLLITLFLVFCGGAVQFIIQKYAASGNISFSGFVLYAPIGVLMAVFITFFDYTLLGRYPKTAYALLSLATLASFVFLERRNGANTYVYYASLLYIPVFAGIIYSLRNKRYMGIFLCGLFYIPAAFFCILAPRMTGLLLLTVSSLVLLTFAIRKGYFGGSKKVSLAIVYIPFILITGFFLFIIILEQPYLLDRIFHPELDPWGSGYQAIMVKKLIAAAKPIGSAAIEPALAGLPIEKLLPGWSADFSLTYIIAKYGYVVGGVIILALSVFIVKMFMLVFKEKNAFGFLLSLGSCIALSAQVLFYLLSNLGLLVFPTWNLPFVSYGSLGFIVNMILISLLLSVHRHSKLVKDPLTPAEEPDSPLITLEDGKLIIDLRLKKDTI